MGSFSRNRHWGWRFAAVSVVVVALGACNSTPQTEVLGTTTERATPGASTVAATFEMPDVSGLPYADARAELRELGADVRRKLVKSGEDRHVVVSQTMPAGSMVASGAVVTLRVSSGKPRKEEPAATDLPPTQITAVPDLPAGLYCRDLKASGYSYAEAVWYWDLEGRPARMDVGNDGVPCTTVFPSSEVAAYEGGRTPLYDLPPGLLCRDLHARGYTYPEAVWYWTVEGQPARMDVGGDGIPCTTVYPSSDVYSYWR